MARYSDTLRDPNLRPIEGALTYVVVSGTNQLAALTDDEGNDLANPFLTQEYGAVVFNTADGLYDLSYRYGGRLVFEEHRVIVGTPASLPLGAVVNSLGNGTTVAPSQAAVQAGLDDAKAFLQSGTGAIATTVQEELRRNVVSVMQFGAVGDGVTSDAAAVQKAITYIGTLGGGEVVFPPNRTYALGAQINICDNLTLTGYGAKLKDTRASTAIHTPIFKNFSGSSTPSPGTRLASKNWVVQGFEVDGQAAGVPGAFVPNADMQGMIFCAGGWTNDTGMDGITFRDIVAYNFAGSGLVVWKSSNVLIENCRGKNFFADDLQSMGSFIDFHEVDKFQIRNNFISHDASGKSWHGMVVLDWNAGCKNGIISGNVVTNMNAGDGISCEGNSGVGGNLDNCIISDNLIRNCQGDGIGIDNCNTVSVQGNRIIGVQCGILCTNTPNVTIIGNTIIGSGLGGIVSRMGTMRAEVHNNYVENITYLSSDYPGHGIHLQNDVEAGSPTTSMFHVCDNTVIDTDGAGIFVVTGRGKITGGVVRNAGRSGSNADNLRACVRTLAGVDVDGVRIHGTGNTRYGISSGASNFPSIRNIEIVGSFDYAYFLIGYRNGVSLTLDASIEFAHYDVRTNIFTGRFNGTPSGYWFRGDTMLATQPSAGGSPGVVCTATGTTWKAMANVAA